MKKYLIFFVWLAFSYSCENGKIFEEYVNEVDIPNTEKEADLRAQQSEELYFDLESWKQIWRWYHYDATQTNDDHYFGFISPKNGPRTTIKNRSYKYECEQFWVTTRDNGDARLYRLYSNVEDAHRLHIASSLGSFQQDEFLGYIYSTQRPGTVPLKEFYREVTKDYAYATTQREIDWGYEHTPDSRYIRTLGYVFPGEKSENEAERTKIYIKINGYEDQRSRHIQFGFLIYAKEKISGSLYEDRFLVYDIHNNYYDWHNNEGELTLSLPENFSIDHMTFMAVGSNIHTIDDVQSNCPIDLDVHSRDIIINITIDKTSRNKYSLNMNVPSS